MKLTIVLFSRTVTSGDKVGRQTGSLAWRLARGELGAPAPAVEWSWKPCDADVEEGLMTVSYDVVSDKYTHANNVKEGFTSGVWSSENVNRKVNETQRLIICIITVSQGFNYR